MRKCLTVGMFTQIAKKVGEVVKNSRSEYRTMVGNKTAAIHPASVLFQKKPYPEAIVYTISFAVLRAAFTGRSWSTPRRITSEASPPSRPTGSRSSFRSGSRRSTALVVFVTNTPQLMTTFFFSTAASGFFATVT